MKQYESPKIECIALCAEDIIQTSGETNYNFTQNATFTGKSATWKDSWNTPGE